METSRRFIFRGCATSLRVCACRVVSVSRQAAKASGTLFKTCAKSYVPLNPIPKWPGTLRAADGCAMRAILPGPRVIPVPPCPRTALRLDRDFYLRFPGGVSLPAIAAETPLTVGNRCTYHRAPWRPFISAPSTTEAKPTTESTVEAKPTTESTVEAKPTTESTVEAKPWSETTTEGERAGSKTTMEEERAASKSTMEAKPWSETTMEGKRAGSKSTVEAKPWSETTVEGERAGSDSTMESKSTTESKAASTKAASAKAASAKAASAKAASAKADCGNAVTSGVRYSGGAFSGDGRRTQRRA